MYHDAVQYYFAASEVSYVALSSNLFAMSAASRLRELDVGAARIAEIQRGQPVRRPSSDAALRQVLCEDVQEHLIVGVHCHAQRRR